MTAIRPLVLKSEFPIFEAQRDLVYLDSAATAQKPAPVIDAEMDFYRTSNANVHRGIYVLAEQATAAYEAARATVAHFVGGEASEIVFTRGATEAINLVAHSFVRPRLMQTRKHSGSVGGNVTPGVKEGLQPQIIVTIAEHHSNFVPWQQLCKETGAKFTVVPLRSPSAVSSSTRTKFEIKDPVKHERILRQAQDDSQEQPWEIDLEFLEQALKERPTAIVAIADVSNVLGTVNPTAKIIELAHKHGAPVLVDAAQSLPHLPVNAGRLGADFIVGSAHKLYGPTGVGFLWGKREHLEAMPPYQFGGDMIRSVSIEETTWNELPWKFEAGTPNIAGAIGFAAAIDWLAVISNAVRDPVEISRKTRNDTLRINWEAIAEHEERLLTYADEQLRAIEGLTILGPTNPRDRASLFAFTVADVPVHDLVSILDEHNVAVRPGRHCAEPLHHSLGLDASARASFAVYNGSDDIDCLVAGIRIAIKTFTR